MKALLTALPDICILRRRALRMPSEDPGPDPPEFYPTLFYPVLSGFPFAIEIE
jgi:hypothetical protein